MKKRNIIDLTGDSDNEEANRPSSFARKSDIIFNEKGIFDNLSSSAGSSQDIRVDVLKDILDPRKGYAVIDFPQDILDKFNVIDFLRDQREFTTVDENQLFVLGGFGAMGNPSSFHHPLRRELMQAIYNYMTPLFARTIQKADLEYKYISMIPDRFGIRRNDQQVSSESWHKDQSLDLERARNAIVFGGWINLDSIGSDIVQYFNCIPGAVVPVKETEAYYMANANRKGGFSSEPEEHVQLNQRRQRIPVKPGQLVVFNELLTHEVAQGEKKGKFDPSRTSYRCYVKWFLSKNMSPYWKSKRLENFFNRQTQIGMSIFQPDAPFYASAHYSTTVDPLISISERVIPPLRTFSIKGEKRSANSLAQRYMGQGNSQKPSEDLERSGLVDWNLQFEAYTNEEKSIYLPKSLY